MGPHCPWRLPKDHGVLRPWHRTFLETRLWQSLWLPGTAIPTGRGTIFLFSSPILIRRPGLEWAWDSWGQRGTGMWGRRAETAVTAEAGEPLARSPRQGPSTCSLEPVSQPDFMYLVENGENRPRKTNTQAYFLKANPASL